MATKKTATEEHVIDIIQVTRGVSQFCIIGESPFVCNRMPEKAKRQLLFPTKKNRAERASHLKHDPMEEYRDSPHRLVGADAPTYLAVPASAFGRAMASAAIDIPGATKAAVGRLVWVEGHRLPLYGVPKFYMDVVKNSDMNKTPDIRTRAIVPEWACYVTVRYVTPLLRETIIANLLVTAGLIIGVGDGRQERGSGLGHGAFRLCGPEDLDFRRIVSAGDRAAQLAAMEAPQFYDPDSEDLFTWFLGEKERLGFPGAEKKSRRVA